MPYFLSLDLLRDVKNGLIVVFDFVSIVFFTILDYFFFESFFGFSYFFASSIYTFDADSSIYT